MNATGVETKIRMADKADCEALRMIYGQYIDTQVSFEYELPSEEAFAERIGEVVKTYPYVVCEVEGRVVGYAYAHRHRAWDAYDWNAELSVYVDKNAVSEGIGRRLYGALMEILAEQGIRNVYGAVTLPNEKSEGLHRTMGFRRLGVFSRTGYKCGKWHDVVWYEKGIGNFDVAPVPLIPVTEVSQSMLASVFEKYSK